MPKTDSKSRYRNEKESKDLLMRKFELNFNDYEKSYILSFFTSATGQQPQA